MRIGSGLVGLVALCLATSGGAALSASNSAPSPRITCEPCPGYGLCEVDPEPEGAQSYSWSTAEGSGISISGPNDRPYVKIICGSKKYGGVRLDVELESGDLIFLGHVRCGDSGGWES